MKFRMPGHDDRDTPMLEIVGLESLVCEQSRRLLQFWRDHGTATTLPPRSVIDPLELRFALGHLVLFDVLHEPLDFRYRLTGSSLTSRFGYDLTGRMLDDHPDPAFRRIARASLTEVVQSARPLAWHRRMVIDGRIHRFETLVLPFAGDDGRVVVVMAMMWPLGGTATAG